MYSMNAMSMGGGTDTVEVDAKIRASVDLAKQEIENSVKQNKYDLQREM